MFIFEGWAQTTTCEVNIPGISTTAVDIKTGSFTCGNGYRGKVSYDCSIDTVTITNDNLPGKTYTQTTNLYQLYGAFRAPVAGKVKNITIKNITGTLTGHVTGKTASYTSKQYYGTFNLWDKNQKLYVFESSYYGVSASDKSFYLGGTVSNPLMEKNERHVMMVTTSLSSRTMSARTLANGDAEIATNSLVWSIEFMPSIPPTLKTSSSCTINNCKTPGAAVAGLTLESVSNLSGSGKISCADVGYTGEVNYSCDTDGAAATITGSCAKKTCSATAGNGYAGQDVEYTAPNTFGSIICGGTSYPLYNGSVSYTCSSTGVVAVTGSCGCVTGYLKNANGQCVQIACSYAAGNGYAGVASRLGVSGSITCGGTGYSSTNAAYTCTAPTPASTTGSILGTFTLTTGCECASGYTKTTAMGACSRITCGVTNGKGYADITLNSTPVGATGTITCGGASYPAYSSTNATYTCTGPTTSTPAAGTAGTFALVTPCACATGYNPDSSGNCVLSICQVSSEYNIISGTVNAATTATSVACKEGYYGTPTYTCIRGDYVQTGTCARIQCSAPSGSNSNLIDGSSLDFTLGTASVNLTCNLGYASSLGATRPSYTCKDGIGTVGAYLQNGTCNPISCTISPGDGYAGRTLSGKDKFPCDTGYYGDINYTCGANNAVTLTGSCSRVR